MTDARRIHLQFCRSCHNQNISALLVAMKEATCSALSKESMRIIKLLFHENQHENFPHWTTVLPGKLIVLCQRWWCEQIMTKCGSGKYEGITTIMQWQYSTNSPDTVPRYRIILDNGHYNYSFIFYSAKIKLNQLNPNPNPLRCSLLLLGVTKYFLT